jgi:hypothetical protein
MNATTAATSPATVLLRVKKAATALTTTALTKLKASGRAAALRAITTY